MAMPFIDHYSGWVGETCSYTTDFITKNASKATDAGMTEAMYRQQLVSGHLGVLVGQHFGAGLKDGQILFRAVHNKTKAESVFSWDANKGKVIQRTKIVNQTPGGKAVVQFEHEFQELHELTTNGTWDMRVPTHRKPAVSTTSDSVGAMTDEDAATMFVKTKDQFAKEKGINIKGANPQLDLEVYEAIAKATGYSPNEIRLKIEAYKASGKKLSALKKKTLKKPDTVTPKPVDPLSPKKPDVDVPPVVAEAKPITGLKTEKKIDLSGNNYYEVTQDGYKVAKIKQTTQSISAPGTKYSYASEKVWSVSVYDTQGNWVTSLTYKTKKQADAYAEKWAGLKFKDVTPKVQPEKIHLSPSTAAVDEAVEDLIEKDLENTLIYKDEDVVKAYIKAKDQLAGQTSNKFTLYTKSDDFDEAIFHLMSKEYGVDLTGKDIKKHISNYLGSGNKVSVLKKKMIKSGELDNPAPTLKKTKAEKQFDTAPTTSKYEAQSQIDDMALTAENPLGSPGFKFNDFSQQEIFDDLKNSIYAKMEPQSAWAKFEEIALKYQKSFSNNDISTLDIIRAYDKKKAKQLGIENGKFYEKKVVEWASTPSGKSYIIKQKANVAAQAKIKAEQLKETAAKKAKDEELLKSINSGVPDLPVDSGMYNVVDMGWAHRMQRAADPWNANEKAGLKHYTGGSYTPMNQYLRGQTSYVTESNRTAIINAQKGMRPTTEPFLVRRGAGYNSFGIGKSSSYGFDASSHNDFKAMIGKTVEEKGFLSTSVGGEGAFGGSVKIEVEVAPGTFGAYVDASSRGARDYITSHPGEREFIVAAGTKYKVLRVTTGGHGGVPNQTIIRLRTIPGSHTRRF